VNLVALAMGRSDLRAGYSVPHLHGQKPLPSTREFLGTQAVAKNLISCGADRAGAGSLVESQIRRVRSALIVKTRLSVELNRASRHVFYGSKEGQRAAQSPRPDLRGVAARSQKFAAIRAEGYAPCPAFEGKRRCERLAMAHPTRRGVVVVAVATRNPSGRKRKPQPLAHCAGWRRNGLTAQRIQSSGAIIAGRGDDWCHRG